MKKDPDPAANGVHIGQDGYLFLADGRHHVFSYFTGIESPDPDSPDVFVHNLTRRAEYCDRTARSFHSVVFPDKCVALAGMTATDMPVTSLYERCYADAVAQSPHGDRVCYPIHTLRGDRSAFSRTDTHYAAPGNLAVTRAILSDLPADVVRAGGELIADRIAPRQGYSGDLGGKFAPPHSETVQALNGLPVKYATATNGLQAGNDGAIVLISSPDALCDRTLLIFGDSFFRLMLPMLAVFYRRVIFCRTRFFHYEMIEAFHPDDVFCGMAERYLGKCVADSARPHFLSYPLTLGRALKPDPGFSATWARFVDQERLAAPHPAQSA